MNITLRGVLAFAIGMIVLSALLPTIIVGFTTNNASSLGLTGTAATIWGYVGLGIAAGVVFFIIIAFTNLGRSD